MLLEKHREKGDKIYMAFVELETLFDILPHSLIWYSSNYNDTNNVINCEVGVKGMHSWSPSGISTLFILAMESITSCIQRPVPWNLLYAVDVMA